MGEQIKAILKGQKVTMEGIGYVGTSCDAAMKVLEEKLGVVKRRENKPEYFQQEVQEGASVAQGQ